MKERPDMIRVKTPHGWYQYRRDDSPIERALWACRNALFVEDFDELREVERLLVEIIESGKGGQDD